jgi:simple sugar transport system permease protein
MLNYIAQHFISFMASGPMIEPPGKEPKSLPILASATLPRIFPGTRLHLGFVLALLCVFVLWFFLWKTTAGFEARVTGLNPEAGSYAGMKPARSVLLGMFMAGGFGGLAGASEILGVLDRMLPNFSPGYGFDGIAVALLGQNTPIGILMASLLFGMIRSGANLMQMMSRVPVSIVYIIQALVILFVIGSNVIVILRKKRAIKKAALLDEQGGSHAN